MSFGSAWKPSRNSLIVLACSAAITLAACSEKKEEPKEAAAAMPSTAL